jgi:hypothetical protein
MVVRRSGSTWPLFVGFATVGWMVVRESDEAWEHVPEFRVFRPVAGTHSVATRR